MPKLAKICPNCGKSFQVWPAYYNRRKYCSINCKARSQGHPPVSGNCSYCDTRITGRRYTSWIEKKHHFCSPECHDAYRRKKPEDIKPNSHAWKRYAREIRAEVNNICVFCGCPREHDRREVHHLHSYLESQDNSKDNLCCLCHHCHRTVETMYKFDVDAYFEFMVPFLQKRQNHFRKLTSQLENINEPQVA